MTGTALSDKKYRVYSEYKNIVVARGNPFNRHFYVYQPPRALAEIDVDLDVVSADIMKLLQEVHS